MPYLENANLFLPEISEGKFEIPAIAPFTGLMPEKWRPVNELNRPFSPEEGVQMFVDDRRLARLWNCPSRYLESLRRASAVLSPDFSLLTDMPVVLSLYNHYRKHWLATYWQLNGISVIPTICWANEKSFDWCFDGEPSKSIVAVSSVGTQRYADTQAAFLKGYDAMLERLQPKLVLFWGKVPKQCHGNIQPVEPFYQRFRSLGKKNCIFLESESKKE